MDELKNMNGRCPYCGELQRMEIDLSAGLPQECISDCTVCCRPIVVIVTTGSRGDAVMRLRSEDDTA